MQLPQVLCVHLPRTQWLDNGIPVKRFDHVSFPETLHMDPYLYCNQGDGASRLLGGVDITLQMLRSVFFRCLSTYLYLHIFLRSEVILDRLVHISSYHFRSVIFTVQTESLILWRVDLIINKMQYWILKIV